MMETKHWAVLCALLLINFGSAEHDVVGSVPSEIDHSEEISQASVPESGPAISHTMTSPSTNEHHSTQSSRVTSGLSSTGLSSTWRMTVRTPVSPTPQSKTDYGINIVSPVEVTSPVKNLKTDHPTTQPPSFPSGSHRPTSQTPLTSTPNSTTLTAHFGPVYVSVISRQPTTTLNESALPLPDTTTQSNQPTPQKTHLHTSAPTPEPEAITTSHIAPSTSASSSSSSPSSASPSHVTSPQPERHPKTSSAPHQTSAKGHAGTPSQLNVGGDTTMIHESPTLDPLLACLVSAFIITAIIITLLLFLKLRRRDNRPEFRRLQDLPMDDMMEDTPLSMYSY